MRSVPSGGALVQHDLDICHIGLAAILGQGADALCLSLGGCLELNAAWAKRRVGRIGDRERRPGSMPRITAPQGDCIGWLMPLKLPTTPNLRPHFSCLPGAGSRQGFLSGHWPGRVRRTRDGQGAPGRPASVASSWQAGPCRYSRGMRFIGGQADRVPHSIPCAKIHDSR